MPFSEDNPFAAGDDPSLGTPAATADGVAPPVEVELGAIASRVGENLQRFGMESAVVVAILVGLVVVMMPVGMVVGIVIGIAVAALGLPQELANVGSMVMSMAQAMLTTVLMLGAYRLFLTGVRGGNPELIMLVQELWAAVKLLVAQLLVGIVSSVLLVPAMGAGVAWYLGYLPPMEAMAVAGANVALTMPVSLVIAVFTQFLGVVLVDQQLGPVGALMECVRVTKGYRLLAGAFLVVLGMAGFFVGLVTCGFAAPLVQVVGAWVHVVMYRGMVAVNGRAPSCMVAEPV